jgi:putative oxidoreductase
VHKKGKAMKKILFHTHANWAPLALRIMLCLVIFPHGAQKLFGWFGGYGLTGTMNFFTDAMGLPWIIGFLVIVLETLGALLLLAGLGTRIIALSFIGLCVGIVLTTHLQNGFFMNWFGNQAGEGYEYFLLWLGMAVSLVMSGGGKWSLDRLYGNRFPKEMVA